jgi:regulator of RNase E activity RraA
MVRAGLDALHHWPIIDSARAFEARSMGDRPFAANSRELLSSALLADVLDALGHRSSALPADVRPLKPRWKVLGRAATLCAVPVSAEPERPYAVEMDCIDGLRPGDVLVATTSGDRGCALWGELLSTAAKARGAVGFVTDGLTRDAARILDMDFPVFAAGYCPLDSKSRLDGISHGQPIRLGTCLVRPGDWIFGDLDGVVAVPADLADAAFARALEKATGENRVRAELAKGRSLREVFGEFGIL